MIYDVIQIGDKWIVRRNNVKMCECEKASEANHIVMAFKTVSEHTKLLLTCRVMCQEVNAGEGITQERLQEIETLSGYEGPKDQDFHG